MKKVLLIVASVLAAGLSAYAQGTVDFNNRNIAQPDGTTVNAPVFAADTTTKLDGTVAFVQIFAAKGVVTDASQLVAQGSAINFRSGTAAGYFSGGSVALTGINFGDVATVQVRAWLASTGGANFAAPAAITPGVGQSALFQVTINAQAQGAPPPLPTALGGLRSFSIVAVPEPTTIALGLLGAALLFIRRRQ